MELTMLINQNPQEKRKNLKTCLNSGKLLRFPGSFSPFVAKLIENEGFDGVYVSGASLSADMGLPDIGLTSQTEVVTRSGQIAKATMLPTIVDADTGFGEPINAARTITLLEEAGVSGCHIEDQRNPKRCGHLENKEIISIHDMSQRIQAIVEARTDKNFQVIARTDARAIEGLDAAINRAKAYEQSGADIIFPEALINQNEFETFRAAIKLPLLINMTEFGKSPILTFSNIQNLGYNIVIYPVTTFRLGMKAIENGLKTLKAEGSQKNLVSSMMTRSKLYEVLEYEKYSKFDENVSKIK
tara:strand:+ start:12279 stop:13178 length:900 start_codon:yes stop_codon:yes gene_type:complete